MRGLHIEGQRDRDFEWIDAHCLVVSTDVEEKSFLVRQVIVVFQAVVDQSRNVC